MSVIHIYCKCGGAMECEISERGEMAIQAFWLAHLGDGCGPTDSVTCAKARREWEKTMQPEAQP